jgi:hypothetical protein
VTYIELDRHGDWKAQLGRELRSAGYEDIALNDPAFSGKDARSYPLSVQQCREVAGALNEGSVDALRCIVRNVRDDGVAVGHWGDVKRALEISSWSAFTGPRRGLSRVVHRVTNDPKAELIWWNDDEWSADDKGDFVSSSPIYIDGPAAENLRRALGSE